MPAEVLHKSRGLEIRRNEKNGFVVASLHYTADPAKRSAEWKKNASAGMRKEEWDKEYEMSYNAMAGAKMFPEFMSGKHKIVVSPPYPEWPSGQIFWGGLDYGARNPSSVHFYTIVDGVFYAVWELYEPCRDPKEFVAKVKSFPHFDRVRYIAADPTVVNRKSTHNKFGLPCTVNELFLEHGLHKLIEGDTAEEPWVAALRLHWTNPEDPTFRILDCCPNMIREFENAIYASETQRLLQGQVFKEQLSTRIDNHAMDDNKYFFNSRPRLLKSLPKGVQAYKRFMK